jgi:hypothetical protein
MDLSSKAAAQEEKAMIPRAAIYGRISRYEHNRFEGVGRQQAAVLMQACTEGLMATMESEAALWCRRRGPGERRLLREAVGERRLEEWRERVAELAAEGLSMPQIGDVLVRPSSVQVHRHQLNLILITKGNDVSGSPVSG